MVGTAPGAGDFEQHSSILILYLRPGDRRKQEVACMSDLEVM
jgi:hypothetical protein